MNKCSLCLHRCFRFEVQECQNASIETWNRAAKFTKLQSVPKIWTKCRLNFHEVEYFRKMKSTNDDLLEKYNTIWDKASEDFKNKFDDEPVYIKNFLV